MKDYSYPPAIRPSDELNANSEEADATRAVNETLEDYTLRYAPYSFRKWTPQVVAITALGGIAYLADFSIGASIGISYGTINAVFAILFAAIIIFLTGIPLSFYAARYNIDLDLISRGAALRLRSKQHA